MEKYQVIARKFRPQTFDQVCGQEAIIQTLKNAIKMKRTAHAYLFCGPHGTGKTSIARLFAKAINCSDPQDGCEPCNKCPSCIEITSGSALDVIEIDGASNRGIDDIRSLNETVGYAPSTGVHKIYIIDEVHMLTKEAFNALLKTLEEPPPNVKFFFATTEPHKVLPTIASRCQRFDLRRIQTESIAKKLGEIAQALEVQIESDAIALVAEIAEGSMRDAQSLLDQILCYREGLITRDDVVSGLGLLPRELLAKLDTAYSNHDVAGAFTLAEEIFSSGCDHTHFVETLTKHFRNVLKTHIGLLPKKGEPVYSQGKALELLDYLTGLLAQKSPFSRLHIEMVLLHIIESSRRIPIDTLIDKLTALKSSAPPTEAKPLLPPKPPAAETPIAKQEAPPPPAIPIAETPIAKPEAAAPIAELAPKPPATTAKVAPPPPAAPEERLRRDNLLRFASVELSATLE